MYVWIAHSPVICHNIVSIGLCRAIAQQLSTHNHCHICIVKAFTLIELLMYIHECYMMIMIVIDFLRRAMWLLRNQLVIYALTQK